MRVAFFLVLFVPAVFGNFLEDFHGKFSDISQATEAELVYLRNYNGALIKEFNRELLLQFGRMVPAMRAADVEFVQAMADYENVSEECLEYLLEVRDFLVRMQNDDIRSCAEWSWRALKEDSLGRFFPYHNSFARDNLAAVSQVMETLGRNRLVQDPERVRVELEGELEYYENLNGGQVELLWKEIVAHADMADETYQYLDECREMTKLMQSFDHEYMMDLLENDCYE